MKARTKDNVIIKTIADEKIASMPDHIREQFVDVSNGANVGELYEKKASKKHSKIKGAEGE